MARPPEKGDSSTQERLDLLQTFVDPFGAQRIAALTEDRESIEKTGVDYLIKHNTSFYIRIKENRLVEWGKEMRHIASFFST
jgi:hypothetical protein